MGEKIDIIKVVWHRTTVVVAAANNHVFILLFKFTAYFYYRLYELLNKLYCWVKLMADDTMNTKLVFVDTLRLLRCLFMFHKDTPPHLHHLKYHEIMMQIKFAYSIW